MSINKTKKISIITLFPDLINSYFKMGILGRALNNKKISLNLINLRTFAKDRRGTVDDRPFGGGAGMLLLPDIVYKSIKKAKGRSKKNSRVILLTPQGKVFNQEIAKKFNDYEHLILLSGRYEGFDDRITEFVDDEISIGDYVLMGGELPALVIVETIARLIPGVLGKQISSETESFNNDLLEYPQYTKPETWEVEGKKLKVPLVLRSGHHAKIKQWQQQQAEKRTRTRRPDLWQKYKKGN